jgi:uncharacterized protein YtpQ (UPF0354 family)
MKNFFKAILVSLGICSGCSKPDLLSPAAFTAEFAAAMQKSVPGIKIESIGELQLKMTATNGQESTAFLQNAYDTYKQDPESKEAIIQRFVVSGVEAAAGEAISKELDRTRIVPIIKDRAWLEETKQALISRGAKHVPENVYDDLNPDLVVLYAEDSPKSIRYFGPEDLEAAHIDRKDLRKLACENLKRMLPKVERHGTNGIYMLTADGNYEASLLLLDSVWSDLRQDVRGDFVVAIPTREVFIVTGSQDAQGITKMKQIVEKATKEGSYRLTTKLFVLHDGKLDEFAP